MKLSVVDTTGARLREIDAADDVFGIEPNVSVVHQAYVTSMANRRAGSASTKRRGEVAGSSAKTRRQKGLGRSRQGSIRASHRIGGGIAKGPKPRDFGKRMPRQMRRLAIRSALSSHAADGSIQVLESLAPGEGRTREVQATLDALGIDRTVLLVTGEHDETLHRASRNIDFARAMPAGYLNVVDLVNAHHVLMTEDAVRQAESLWGGDSRRSARRTAAAEVS
ncbi:MAG: 50S ribosomal protein L4 [Dehalococcoidia bacterium]|nr:50S ribosomal protein L4 [Dehalococcoidia bacterium]